VVVQEHILVALTEADRRRHIFHLDAPRGGC
jgi:hypothetical protein